MAQGSLNDPSQLTDGAGVPVVVGSTTSAASLPVVIASDQAAVAIKDGGGSITIDAAALPLPTGAATETTVAAINTATGTTADADTANTVIGRLKQIVTKLAGGLPAALVGGRLDANIGAWLGSTAPTVGQKTAAASLPQVVASDQWPDALARSIFTKNTDGTNVAAVKPASTLALATDPALVVAIRDAVAVTMAANGYGGQVEGRAADAAAVVGNPVLMGGYESATGFARRLAVDALGRLITTTAGTATNTAGFAFGEVTLAAAGVAALIYKTAYTEQTANFVGSIISSSANDSAAGTGARQVQIHWMSLDGSTKGVETATLNGTTSVPLVTATKCFIEKVEVISVGSGGTNAGIITLRNAAVATVCTIAIGEWRTNLCHHYVKSGQTCYVTSQSANNTSSAVGNSCVFQLRAQALGGTAPNKPISDYIRVFGQASSILRTFGTAIAVPGPAHIEGWATPESAVSTTERMSFDFYDQG